MQLPKCGWVNKTKKRWTIKKRRIRGYHFKILFLPPFLYESFGIIPFCFEASTFDILLATISVCATWRANLFPHLYQHWHEKTLKHVLKKVKTHLYLTEELLKVYIIYMYTLECGVLMWLM